MIRKNTLLILMILTLTAGVVSAQSLNQITIIPANPTETDTILVISDFSYQGNCAFGMVYIYTTLVDSTILIMPTYCGYWDTTQCNSIDTFKVGPFPAGPYIINIEYHQGSVCPYSGFDATIYQFDTAIVISTFSTIAFPLNNDDVPVKLYPNPAIDQITVEIIDDLIGSSFTLSDMVGRTVLSGQINSEQTIINTVELATGVYILLLHHPEQRAIKVIKEK